MVVISIVVATQLHCQTLGIKCECHESSEAILNIRVVFIARVINLGVITRVMLYEILPVGTTFDTIPRVDTSMTLLSISIATIAFPNDKNIYLLKVLCRVKEMSVKYSSTTEIKIQVFRFGKGDEIVGRNLINKACRSNLLDEKTKGNVKKKIQHQK